MLGFKKCCCTLWFTETSGLPLACEQRTHFRSSLLSLRKYVCCSQASRHVLFRLFQPLQSERDSDCSRFALKRVFRRLIHLFFDSFLLIRTSAGTKWWKDTDWSNNILRHWPRNTRHNVWNYIGLNYKRLAVSNLNSQAFWINSC